MKKVVSIFGILTLVLTSSFAQEVIVKKDSLTKGKSTYIKIKEEAKPLVIIDGKKYDSDILDLLDQDLISKMDVLKGEMAMKEYNTESVIVISSKSKSVAPESRIVIKSDGKDLFDQPDPVIIIDGKISTKKSLDELSPDDIFSVTVLKDEESLTKYKTKVGVVLIKTKKR